MYDLTFFFRRMQSEQVRYCNDFKGNVSSCEVVFILCTIQLIQIYDIEFTYHRTQKLQLHSYRFYLILVTSSNIRWQHWMKANGLCSWSGLSFQQRVLVYSRHSHSTYGLWYCFHCSLSAHWYIASSSYATV